MDTIQEAPVINGPQAQGDLLILPWPADDTPRRGRDVASVKPLTATEVVLTGNDGHDHALAPGAGVAWHRYPAGQTLGVLSVDEGAVAVLRHVEHGASRIGPGVYVIRRQREQRDLIEMVQD